MTYQTASAGESHH